MRIPSEYVAKIEEIAAAEERLPRHVVMRMVRAYCEANGFSLPGANPTTEEEG